MTGREGRCYELALKYIMAEDEGTLVHGVVWSYVRGEMIGHAWVVSKDGLAVWEPVSDKVFPKAWLYNKFRMREEQTYTPEEAMIMAVKTKNYGPWE